MAQQLIFTSVPRGYQPGASGYCTAARSEQMRAGLVQRLEQMSVYSHRTVSPNPTILAYRLVDLGGVKYRVLSRIRDAGLDFTQRSNFIAHHLAFEPGESVGGASPAEILLFWDGWKDQWEGNPSALQDEKGDVIGSPVRKLFPPCKHWEDLTGDSGWGAFPWNHSGSCCWVHEKLDEFELLHLMGETLRLKSSGKIDALWETSFTTYLGTIVEASKYHWSAWNALDPIPTGKELGKNLIRVESLNGDPIGSKELIEIARRGYTSNGIASNIQPALSAPKEVKTQAQHRNPSVQHQRKESDPRTFIPSAKTQKNYFPALIATIAAAIISLASIFLYTNSLEENKKSSDTALANCIESISEKLSRGNRDKQVENYNSDLPDDQLKSIKETDQESIRKLDKSVRNLNDDQASMDTVLEAISEVENVATTDESKKKIDALRAKIIKWGTEKRKAKIKSAISVRIRQIIQTETINYEADMNRFVEIKTDWKKEISEDFPYEYIQEIIAIGKEISLCNPIESEQFNKSLKKLENYNNPEARDYALKVKQHEETLREKYVKNIKSSAATQPSTDQVIHNQDTRKYENIILKALFGSINENILQKYPNATFSYCLEENLVFPDGFRKCQHIGKIELSNFKTTDLNSPDVFDESGFLKSSFNNSPSLLLICQDKEKANILAYSLDKPCDLEMNVTDQKNGIINSLKDLKEYLETTLIFDPSGKKKLQWIICKADSEKTIKTGLDVLDREEINIIYELLFQDKQTEILNGFKRAKGNVTLQEIATLWLNRPNIQTTNNIKILDEAVKAYLSEKEKTATNATSLEYSGLNESKKADKIKQNVQKIMNEHNVWIDGTDSDKKARQADTIDLLGAALQLKVNQYRGFLFIGSNNDITKIKQGDYKEISANKNNQNIIMLWDKYRKYLEEKSSGDKPEPQKEYEWLLKHVLLKGRDYKLYLGPVPADSTDGVLKYFQIITN